MLVNRTNIKRFITRAKTTLVDDMELPETPPVPDPRDVALTKKRVFVTKESARASLEQDINLLANSGATSKSSSPSVEAIDLIGDANTEGKRVRRKVTERKVIVDDEEDAEMDIEAGDTANNSEEEENLEADTPSTSAVPSKVTVKKRSGQKLDFLDLGTEFCQQLTDLVVMAKSTFHEFKMGVSLTIKYDHIKNKAFVHCCPEDWLEDPDVLSVQLYDTGNNGGRIPYPYLPDDDVISVMTENTATDATALIDLRSTGENSTSETVLLENTRSMRINEKDERQVCSFFTKTGQCKFGDNCRYAHPEPIKEVI